MWYKAAIPYPSVQSSGGMLVPSSNWGKFVQTLSFTVWKTCGLYINAKEGTGTYTRLKKLIDAMTISLSYIEDAIK